MDTKDFLLHELSQLVREQKLVKWLQDGIEELKAEIHILKHPKDSNTGSVPPSKDGNRKTRGLRPKMGKKSGGQPAHSGSTLEMKVIPDDERKLPGWPA